MFSTETQCWEQHCRCPLSRSWPDFRNHAPFVSSRYGVVMDTALRVSFRASSDTVSPFPQLRPVLNRGFLWRSTDSNLQFYFNDELTWLRFCRLIASSLGLIPLHPAQISFLICGIQVRLPVMNLWRSSSFMNHGEALLCSRSWVGADIELWSWHFPNTLGDATDLNSTCFYRDHLKNTTLTPT